MSWQSLRTLLNLSQVSSQICFGDETGLKSVKPGEILKASSQGNHSMILNSAVESNFEGMR